VDFASYAATSSARDVRVISKSSGRSGLRVKVIANVGGSEIDIRVHDALYDAVRPNQACLHLIIEKGRYGVERTIVPSEISPLLGTKFGIDRLVHCGSLAMAAPDEYVGDNIQPMVDENAESKP
jgi:hypothetical protein